MNPTIVTMPEVGPANWTGEEPLYEVVDGQRKELPPMGAYLDCNPLSVGLPPFRRELARRVAPRVTVITPPRLVLWFLPCAGGVAVDGVALSRPSG